RLPALNRLGHAGHSNRCLQGLPSSLVEFDSSRMAVGFYCLGILDLYGLVDDKVSTTDSEGWRAWIWAQQATGAHGSGFRPGPLATTNEPPPPPSCHPPDVYGPCSAPNLIMTYTALQALAILRDDFAPLDRPGLARFVGACQGPDGSFATTPGARDADLRMSYCAFAICAMLDDWTRVDVDRALAFVARCRTFEGGYGQAPHCEAQAPSSTPSSSSSPPPTPTPTPPPPPARLPPAQRAHTVRWLVQKQSADGGFCGRTGKAADACYGFWCGAALRVLGADTLVDARALARFVARCQFRFGGIAKAPGEHPDPYHTYLSSAMLAIYCAEPAARGTDARWALAPLDPLLNARQDTARWAREHI
ncbi:hypothetical protein HETIRDRAFT_239432, partial [Heterobasidion irregulare TC 32-1]